MARRSAENEIAFAEVARLCEQGFGPSTIINKTGLSRDSMQWHRRVWRNRLLEEGLPVPPCICGLPINHRASCSEKYPSGCRNFRRSAPSDLAEMAKVMTQRRLRKHYSVGRNVLRRWLVEGGIWYRIQPTCRGYRPARSRIEAMAEAGLQVDAIVIQTGLARSTVKFYIKRWRRRLRSEGRPLPACQCGGANADGHRCQYRGRADKIRPLVPKASSSAIADALYSEIERFIPRGFAADVRADIISDMYLAILEKRLDVEQLGKVGRTFMNRTIKQCGGAAWTYMVSSDKLRGGDRSVLDSLDDPTALEAFNCIFDDQDMDDR